MAVANSVTKLGDLMHFVQVFKALGHNDFAQMAHVLGNFCKGIKIFHFSRESFLGYFIDIWRLFIGHTGG